MGPDHNLTGLHFVDGLDHVRGLSALGCRLGRLEDRLWAGNQADLWPSGWAKCVPSRLPLS